MTKPFLFSILCLLFANVTFASIADSVVNISSATENYRFFYNPKSGSVQIKQKVVTNYTANNYQANIPIAQAYNNNVSIDEVTCKVDGKTPGGFKPEYTYYSSADVFYSDQKICYFPLTIPKKGGVGVVTFEETVNDPRYFTSIRFSEPYFVNQKEVTVKIPRWMKVELKEYNFERFDIKRTTQYVADEDADIFIYKIMNLPAAKHESNSPGPTYIYPHLLILSKSAVTAAQTFTFFNTLNDQYSWYRTLSKNTVADKVALTDKAKEITAGLTDDLARIKAVFYYVQDKIRYIAFEDGLAGFRPENADEVLRKKYGDCKGMANLTKALLTSLGYDARLCWLGTNHIAYDYQTPSLAVDNHMICAIDIRGKTYFLDATESFIGFNEYAERIQGRQVLIEDGDKFILKRIPVANMDQNASIATAKLAIVGDALTGNINHLWKGEDKEEILSGINGTRREKMEDAIIKYLAGDNNDYKIAGLQISGTNNPDKDLMASYLINTKNGISSFGKSYYLDLDHSKELIDASIKTGERTTDYWFDHKSNVSYVIDLVIPQGYKVATVPAALNIVKSGYEFHIQYTINANLVTYKKTILIKDTKLQKVDFSQWNADIEELVKTYNDALIIKPITE